MVLALPSGVDLALPHFDSKVKVTRSINYKVKCARCAGKFTMIFVRASGCSGSYKDPSAAPSHSHKASTEYHTQSVGKKFMSLEKMMDQ